MLPIDIAGTRVYTRVRTCVRTRVHLSKYTGIAIHVYYTYCTRVLHVYVHVYSEYSFCNISSTVDVHMYRYRYSSTGMAIHTHACRKYNIDIYIIQ